MRVAIKQKKRATDEEWDHALVQCEHATFFHSREWAEIWRQYNGLCPYAQKIVFSDGKYLVLPCSYYTEMKGLIKKVVMSAAETFGGPLYGHGISAEHLRSLSKMIGTFHQIVWRQNPYDPLLKTVWSETSKSDVTHVLDLDKGFSHIEQIWKKNILRKVRSAQNSGVQIRQADKEKDWADYYDVYEGSLVRWGDRASSKYEWELFNLIYNYKSMNIKLWLAEYNESIAAGAICFYQNSHVVYWHGAAQEKYFSFRPTNLLFYEIIKNATENGYSWFDFNPSGGHEGVTGFKKSFGTSVLESNVYYHTSKKTNYLRRFRNWLA